MIETKSQNGRDMRKLVRWNHIMIKVLKVLPVIMGLLYFINIILGYFGISMLFISLLSGVSLLPLIFLYIASYALGFCNYHRMFLHYIATSDFILYLISFIGITLSTYYIFLIMMVLAGVFLFIILYQWLHKK